MSSGTDVKPRLQTKKHRSKTFYVFISSFSVSVCLLTVLLYPIISNKPSVDIVQEQLDDVIPDNVLTFFPSPVHSFGSDGYYEINGSAHFSYFDNNSDWTLYYSDDENSWSRILGLDADVVNVANTYLYCSYLENEED